MTSPKTKLSDRSRLRQRALQRWETEGGAGPGRLSAESGPDELPAGDPPLGNAELVQLQIRVIALENMVIALLSRASDSQLDLVRAMAVHIAPRAGFTPHRLTIHAAAQMISLVERAGYFRPSTPAKRRAVKPDAPAVGG